MMMVLSEMERNVREVAVAAAACVPNKKRGESLAHLFVHAEKSESLLVAAICDSPRIFLPEDLSANAWMQFPRQAND